MRSALSATHHSRGRQSCAVLGRAAYSADPSAAPPQDGSLASFPFSGHRERGPWREQGRARHSTGCHGHTAALNVSTYARECRLCKLLALTSV